MRSFLRTRPQLVPLEDRVLLSFSPPVNFAVGREPISVATADFNQDGLLDLATANVSGNTLGILLAAGEGTFIEAVYYPTDSSPTSILSADLNADGKPDLAAANARGGTVTVLLGLGDGTFVEAGRLHVGSNPWSVAAGDFNGDGILDLATANSAGNTVGLLLGYGDGTFQPPAYLATGLNPTSVVAADLNHDGRLDLATGNLNGSGFTVLLGNGDGTFQDFVFRGLGTRVAHLAAGDLNRDGVTDLVTANINDASAFVLLGYGDGSFQEPVRTSTGPDPAHVAVHDLDRNGTPDLVAANAHFTFSGVHVLWGNGDGTFQNPVPYAAGAVPTGIAVADFSRDGQPDLAVANFGSDTVSILFNERVAPAEVLFADAEHYAATGGNGTIFVATGDLNRDGIPDMVAANVSNNTLSVFLGNGDGTFQSAQTFSSRTNSPRQITIVDLNRDGLPDLAVANLNDTRFSVYLGNGDGTFQAPLFTLSGANIDSLVVVDFNRDGLLDVAASNSSRDYISVHLGNGDGTFLPPTQFTVATSCQGIVSADFNRDGIADLAIARYALNDIIYNEVFVLLGNGDGTFQDAVSYEVGRGPHGLEVGDINRDGILDLVSGNYGQARERTLSLLFGLGDGTFFRGEDVSVSAPPLGLTLADINGDGRLDLLAPTPTLVNRLYLFLGDGYGGFTDVGFVTAGRFPYNPGVGDFDRDGLLDLAVPNIQSNDVSVLLNRSVGSFPDGPAPGELPWDYLTPGRKKERVTFATMDV